MKVNNKKIILVVISLITFVIIASLAIYNLLNQENSIVNQSKNSNKSANVNNKNKNNIENIVEYKNIDILKPNENDVILGQENAPVVFIEYASLSCPHCATFYDQSFDQINEKYIKTGKIKFIYRDFPLNKPAFVAATLALCQAQNYSQQKAEEYYKFIKALFKTQESWAFTKDFMHKLETISKLNGIDSKEFTNCINNDSIQEIILNNRIKANKDLELNSTPTFFIGTQKITGYRNYEEIKNAIDSELKKNKSTDNDQK